MRKNHIKREKNHSFLTLEPLENRLLLSSTVIDDIGNSFRHATDAALDDSGDLTLESDLYSRKDRDVTSFTANGSGKMNLVLDTTDSELTPIVRVYDQRHKLVAISNYRQHQDQSHLAFLVEQGSEYSVRIQSARRTSGEYSLTLDGPAAGEHWTEDHADSRRDAEVITEAGTYTGQILNARSNDTDIMAFTALQSGTISVTMTPQDETLNAVLIARKENGRAIARANDSDSDGSESISFDVEAGRTYYIQADGYKRSQGSYSLEVAGAVLSEPMISDPDDISKGTTNYDNVHALLIGATDYTVLNDLPVTANDVTLMSETLQNILGVSADNITTLVGGGDQVNNNSVKAALNWLDQVTGENDLAILYYSGHGGYGKNYTKDDNETLILPDNTTITESYLKNVLADFESSSGKMLILDSCYSGGFAGIANSVDNTMVIASSAHNQVSWGNIEKTKSGYSGQSSVFTDWFAAGLAENANESSPLDTNSDNKVSFAEAFVWADQMVNDITGTNWKNQDPLMSILKGDIVI